MTEYAGLGRRFGAFLIDAILLPIFGLLALMFMLVFEINTSKGMGAIIVYIAFLIGMPLYFAFLESSRHQATFGKALMKIYVTDVNMRRISFFKAVLRSALLYLSLASFVIAFGVQAKSFMFSLFFIFGMASHSLFLLTEKRQGLHDIIAGTLVLRRVSSQNNSNVEQVPSPIHKQQQSTSNESAQKMSATVALAKAIELLSTDRNKAIMGFLYVINNYEASDEAEKAKVELRKLVDSLCSGEDNSKALRLCNAINDKFTDKPSTAFAKSEIERLNKPVAAQEEGKLSSFAEYNDWKQKKITDSLNQPVEKPSPKNKGEAPVTPSNNQQSSKKNRNEDLFGCLGLIVTIVAGLFVLNTITQCDKPTEAKCKTELNKCFSECNRDNSNEPFLQGVCQGKCKIDYDNCVERAKKASR